MEGAESERESMNRVDVYSLQVKNLNQLQTTCVTELVRGSLHPPQDNSAVTVNAREQESGHSKLGERRNNWGKK